MPASIAAPRSHPSPPRRGFLFEQLAARESPHLEAFICKSLGKALGNTVEVEPSLTRAARREERFDRLQAAIDSMSPDQRRVILLVRVEDLSVKEV